jgi:beta-aspartyl-peptidase (threonine type)
MPAAWSALQQGGTALDAVEAGTRAVEDNPDDHTVGYAGHPNIDGIVELDASIMDGASRRAGAVGGLRGYRHAITVARAVMDSTPHALITGDGAARLAGSIGEPEDNMLTEE